MWKNRTAYDNAPPFLQHVADSQCSGRLRQRVSDTGCSAPRCIVPAKPGGGMDLSCKLVQKAMPSQQFLITYLPGGVGAVAWTRC
jgi:hypothetical protein